MEEALSTLPDRELVLRSSDTPGATEILLRRHAKLIRSLARPLFLTGADHEDLVQEGMIGLLQAIRTYRPESDTSFQTYAAVCVQRRLISAVRAASAQKHAPLNDYVSFHSFSFDIITDESLKADPEADFIGREGFNEFMNALQSQLSSLEKKVLPLYLSGLSYREIGEQLHKDAKSADNAVQRIRKKAAQIIGENGSPV